VGQFGMAQGGLSINDSGPKSIQTDPELILEVLWCLFSGKMTSENTNLDRGVYGLCKDV